MYHNKIIRSCILITRKIIKKKKKIKNKIESNFQFQNLSIFSIEVNVIHEKYNLE